MSESGIIVIGSLNPTKECQDRVRVFGVGGVSPGLRATDYKDPPKILENSKMSEKQILKIGQISVPGSQAGQVYSEGGYRQQSALAHTDTQLDTSSQRYELTDKISYCLDANYWKGTTFESFLSKHRRQLVIETWTQE